MAATKWCGLWSACSGHGLTVHQPAIMKATIKAIIKAGWGQGQALARTCTQALGTPSAVGRGRVQGQRHGVAVRAASGALRGCAPTLLPASPVAPWPMHGPLRAVAWQLNLVRAVHPVRATHAGVMPRGEACTFPGRPCGRRPWHRHPSWPRARPLQTRAAAA